MSELHIVLLIHGIRTQGSWSEMVAATLEKEVGVRVLPIKYGFFDTVRFLSPFWTRNGPVKRLVQEYRDTRRRYPEAKISIIAHSFGTYALANALKEPDLEFFRIILCGSIVTEKFRVAPYRAQIQFYPILNDCGTHDIWPPLARAVTWGYGATGTFGFGTLDIRDRFNKFSHSQYFSKDFVEEFWLPFISNGEIISTSWEIDRASPPYWQSLLGILPLRWLPVVAACTLGLFGWQKYDQSRSAELLFKNSIIAGQLLGASEVGIQVSLENDSRNDVIFSEFRGTLTSPEGNETRMNYYGVFVGNGMQPPIPSLQISSSDNQLWSLSFRSDFSAQQPILFRVERFVVSERIIANSWDPTRDILPPSLTKELEQITSQEFAWTSGLWSFDLQYRIDGELHQDSVGFEVTESDIDRMIVATPYLSTGLGVFPNWQFLGPDGQTTAVTLPFE